MMRELLELRVNEEYAEHLFSANEGTHLSDDMVRKVLLPTNDPRIAKIGELQNWCGTQGERFFFGWSFQRLYSEAELESAALFHLEITAVFEPAGEECGTVYDESTACTYCGTERKQVSDLRLDLRKAPKSNDLARTIADEWIVSQRLAELLIDEKMTGFELRPVRHIAKYDDDSIDPREYPSGRELLRGAESAGSPHPTGAFWVWLNRTEQTDLLRRMKQEHISAMQKRRSTGRARPQPVWHQLIITSQLVPIVPPTRFGVNPFDEDAEGNYRCPLGHVAGLNLLSEVTVARDALDGSDFMRTREMVGIRRGLLRPAPLLLISPRMMHMLKANNIKGYKVEVAHLA